MEPKTRLDRLVQIRARTEDEALDELVRARRALGRATERLAALRAQAREDVRKGSAAALWELEEKAHARLLQSVRAAERDLASAHAAERQARAQYEAVWRRAEAARKAQGRQRVAILTDREKREQRAADELASMGFSFRS